MSDERRWTPAIFTSPPVTIDLTAVRMSEPWPLDRFDPSGPDPITFRIDGRTFTLPPGTRYVRYGVTQEGLLVEYQAEDGSWETPVEVVE